MSKSYRFASTLLCLCGTALAQVDRGNIQGLVIDPTGAAVVGAEVRLVNSATNLSQQTVTKHKRHIRLLQYAGGTLRPHGGGQGLPPS
jgi:hypothetical protein